MGMILERVVIGITKYSWIMRRVHEADVSADAEFQKSYNGFYRMRQRTADFYQTYYAFLEQNKGNPDLRGDSYIFVREDRCSSCLIQQQAAGNRQSKYAYLG